MSDTIAERPAIAPGPTAWRAAAAAARRARPPRLWEVLLAFVALSVLYGVLVPFGEHPDETFHMSYVAWLADRRVLPNAFAPDRPVREAHQPPLYYAVAAVVWTAIAPGLPETQQLADATLLVRNPDFGSPDGRQNNRYLHTPDERLPFAPWVRAIQLLRLALLPISVGIVAGTYALARRLRPERPGFALFAAAAVAFLPQFIFLSGSITNDLLPTLAASWTLVILGGAIRAQALSRSQALGVGALLAAGLLAKDSMLTLLPAVFVGLALAGRRVEDVVRGGAWLAVPVVLAYGPYALRSLVLYGSVLGSAAQSVTVPYMVHDPRSPFSPYFLETAPTAWSSFVAYFGWLSIPPGRLRLPYDVFALLATSGLLLFVVRAARGRQLSPEVKLVAMLVAAVAGSAIGYVWHNLSIDSPQGRHLFTALPAFGVLAALGADEVARALRAGPSLRRASLLAFLAIGPAYAAAVGLVRLLPNYGGVVLP